MTNNVNRAVALRITELLNKKKMTQYRLALNSGIYREMKIKMPKGWEEMQKMKKGKLNKIKPSNI